MGFLIFYEGPMNTGSTPSVAKSDRWFAMDLNYDWGYNQNQYNGNISGIRWQSAGDGAERSYGYDYDAANRLLLADFTQRNNNQWARQTASGKGIDFSVKMGTDGSKPDSAYDANGNIKRMQQWGMTPGGGAAQIDSLLYSYFDNSNKLKSVTDFATR